MRVINRKALAAAFAVALAGCFAVGAAHSAPATAAGPDATYLVLAPRATRPRQAAARVAARRRHRRRRRTARSACWSPGRPTPTSRPPRPARASRRSPPRPVSARRSTRTQTLRDGRLRDPAGHRRPDRRAAVRPAVGHDADRRRRRPTRSRPAAPTSSSACWTAASPAPTRTWRRRSPRTRAPRASAAWSTRARPRGTRPPPRTARTSPARSPGRSTASASPASHPGVKVASVKVVNDDGFIYPEAAVCGFIWAADHGMQITNNSYFIDPWEFNCRNDARQRPVWQAVQRALRYSQSKGVLNIASAGNSNVDLQHKFIDGSSPNDGSSPVEDRDHQRRLPRPAGRGPRRRHRVGGRHGAAEELLLLLRAGRRRRHRARRRHPPAEPGGLDDRARRAVQHVNTVTQPTAGATCRARRWPARTRPVSRRWRSRRTRTCSRPRWRPSWSAPPKRCRAPTGVYNPRPGLNQYLAECTGGSRNSFYGAGEVNAFNAVR